MPSPFRPLSACSTSPAQSQSCDLSVLKIFQSYLTGRISLEESGERHSSRWNLLARKMKLYRAWGSRLVKVSQQQLSFFACWNRNPIEFLFWFLRFLVGWFHSWKKNSTKNFMKKIYTFWEGQNLWKLNSFKPVLNWHTFHLATSWIVLAVSWATWLSISPVNDQKIWGHTHSRYLNPWKHHRPSS